MQRFEHQEDLDTRVSALEKQMKTSVYKQEDNNTVDRIKSFSKYTSFKDKTASTFPNSRKRSTYYQGTRSKRSVQSVAFTAKLSHELTGLPVGKTIVFDTMVTSTTDYYNNATGIFTCPHAGLYLFAIFVESSGGEAVIALKRDGVDYISAISEPGKVGDDDSGGNVVLLPLADGERVWVETDNPDMSLWPHFTTFSGVLIDRY
ncbi:collagen alpha-1(VIII) chain-like [Mercenaria mercenaria]|uniref:collagen alpha-1(VIII) chain-like n=1 Tax=Mercenaria mercenaria TaxID=6596 RepID=UPI001E1DCA31|nr:collagen alpha-1(VIII) chain-like [Mercenaria mercenaria]